VNLPIAVLAGALAVSAGAWPSAADPGGPVLLQAGYGCVTPPGEPCPPTTREIVVRFDEAIDFASALDTDNYLLYPVDDPESPVPVEQVFDLNDSAILLFLAFTPMEVDHLLTVSGVADLDGNVMEPAQQVLVSPIVAVDELPAVTSLVLMPNRPNPFNPATEIRFALPSDLGDAPVSLTVHDLAGRRVRGLPQVAGMGPGPHAVVWDGRDDGGRSAPSGAYLVRLRAGEAAAVRKITLVR
jgi:hypothetical protein